MSDHAQPVGSSNNSLATVRSTLAIARQPNFAGWTAVVMFAWTIVGLALLLLFARTVSFPPPSPSEVVGRITVQRYPKYQESIYLVLTVGGVPTVVGLGWLIWVALSSRLARWTRLTANAALRLMAIATTLLLILTACYLRFDPQLGKYWVNILWIMIAAIVLGLIVGGLVETQAATQPLDSSSTAASRKLPRPLRIFGNFAVYFLIPALLYAMTLNWKVDGAVDFFHEGEFLVPLGELQHGAVPYRDIYLQHGLFHNALVPWLGGQIFEPTLAGVRSIHRIIFPLGAVAVYLLGVTLLRGGLISALILAGILCGPHLSTTPRGIFAMLALACVARAIRRSPRFESLNPPPATSWRDCMGHYFRRGWQLWLAGIFSGLAFWYSVEVGLFSVAAIALFLGVVGLARNDIPWRQRLAPLACFAAGEFAGFWLVGWYFLIHGALGDVYRNVVIQCVYQTDVWGIAFPTFSGMINPLVRGQDFSLWLKSWAGRNLAYYLPPAIFLLAGVWLTARFVRGEFWRSTRSLGLLLLLLAGCIFFRTTLGRTDGSHLYYATDFLVLIASYLSDDFIVQGLGECRRRFQRCQGALHLLTGSLIAWGLLSYSVFAFQPWAGIQAGWRRLSTPSPATQAKEVQLEKAGHMVLPDAQLKQLQNLIAALDQHAGPDDPIIDFTNQTGLLFFANRRSATRYFHVCYAVTKAQQQEIVDMLEQRRPLVIWKSGAWSEGFDGIPQTMRTPLVANYLTNHYDSITITNSRFILGVAKPK